MITYASSISIMPITSATPDTPNVNRPAYLLTWSPKRWREWSDAKLEELAAKTRSGRPVTIDWSTAGNRSIRKGDRVFLLRQGVPPKGILGSGFATSDVYDGKHFEDPDKPETSIDVEFHVILKPKEVFPRNKLDAGALGSVYWDIQRSGCEIKPRSGTKHESGVLPELERRWKRHLLSIGFTVDEFSPHRGKNPSWTTDELILALDLYFRVSPLTISKENPEVIALSEILNKLPIHRDRPDAERFRNPNGVYMKLCNFLRLDPSYHGAGLQAGSHGDEIVWNAYAGDRARLHVIAAAIRACVDSPIEQLGAVGDDPADTDEATEGAILTRLHCVRERNRDLIGRKKQKALELFGVLRCEVCSFDFRTCYGEIGEGFIECHHIKPLSALAPNAKTKLADLALVCANCHRMLHRGRAWPSLADLRCRVQNTSSV